MSHPGPETNLPAQQPWEPPVGNPAPTVGYQPWAPPMGEPVPPAGYQSWAPSSTPATAVPVPPAKKTGLAKWLPIAGSVAVAGVIGVAKFGLLAGLFGAGDQDVGDCVQLTGATEFEVVDCDAAEAEYRILAVDATDQTYDEFMADLDSCADFPTTEIVLWSGAGGVVSETGDAYCAGAV